MQKIVAPPARRGEVDTETLIEIATLYYYEDVTQEVLSQRFNMSRVKVSRLLRRAREEGLVEIRVHQPSSVGAELEREFIDRFGISRLLVSVDHRDPDAQRNAVARMVAGHLEKALTPGAVVAVGMGRNVAAVADVMATPARGRGATFVCAIGGSLRAGEYMNADHICRRLAARFGGESETLYAPALVTNASLRAELLRNDTVKLTLDRARRADIALVGIGDLSEDSNMVRMGWFTPAEIAEARLGGTIGDVFGYDFIDIHGRPADTGMQGRVIGLKREDLDRIPDVIAIAAENTKAPAILGALRTGAINTLATSFSNVHTILQLDDATRRVA
ncbi:sugar-binding transcriptional regulator [Rhizosaccharibacter radicis]|uniref:Sugar-binding transcriptional regulator n=1 Tax=Rhizosaccharibacter radicis TaxID=2782605 RepID=A0ABT1VSP2_9PROT|nr:sugar-binding transcriptional regulator [Acetobacteraceae bacterium KSS12]